MFVVGSNEELGMMYGSGSDQSIGKIQAMTMRELLHQLNGFIGNGFINGDNHRADDLDLLWSPVLAYSWRLVAIPCTPRLKVECLPGYRAVARR
jgi:hypothetical protein